MDFKDFEIIVVNDGSNDGSHSEILKFSDSIKYINLDKNKGLPNARNLGIREAAGRYIFNLDSDDYIHPETLSFMLLAIELNPFFDSVACDYVYTDLNDKKGDPVSSKDFPIACGILFKRQILIELGLYDEDLKIHEEKDLLMRYKKKHSMLHLPIPFYRYLQHEDNISKSLESEKYMKLLKKKHQNEI
tara:strand:+ start:1697 stop:2263 length:567 start_codon:yes stop_codon:yes gene_type:complete